MKSKLLLAIVALAGFAPHALAQHDDSFDAPDDITFRTASIVSEGTRMAAEVFSPHGARRSSWLLTGFAST